MTWLSALYGLRLRASFLRFPRDISSVVCKIVYSVLAHVSLSLSVETFGLLSATVIVEVPYLKL